MPITFVVDSELGIVRTHAEGSITFSIVQEHIDRMEAEQLLTLCELVDARESRTDLTAVEVRQIVDRLRDTHLVLGSRAIVASDDVSFGLARMFGILCDNFGAPVEVFRALEPAMAWLGARAIPGQPTPSAPC